MNKNDTHSRSNLISLKYPTIPDRDYLIDSYMLEVFIGNISINMYTNVKGLNDKGKYVVCA